MAKMQNCPKCEANKSTQPYFWDVSSAEDGLSGKYLIVWSTLEIPLSKISNFEICI